MNKKIIQVFKIIELINNSKQEKINTEKACIDCTKTYSKINKKVNNFQLKYLAKNKLICHILLKLIMFFNLDIEEKQDILEYEELISKFQKLIKNLQTKQNEQNKLLIINNKILIKKIEQEPELTPKYFNLKKIEENVIYLDKKEYFNNRAKIDKLKDIIDEQESELKKYTRYEIGKGIMLSEARKKILNMLTVFKNTQEIEYRPKIFKCLTLKEFDELLNSTLKKGNPKIEKLELKKIEQEKLVNLNMKQEKETQKKIVKEIKKLKSLLKAIREKIDKLLSKEKNEKLIN